MKNPFRALVLILLAVCTAGAVAADAPWRAMTNPTVAQVAANFKDPPAEYCNTVCWGWNGAMSEEVIARDLNTLHTRGFRIATIEAGYRMDNSPYLSEEWFKLIRFACETAKKLDMRLVIIDEGKYPSGFVNGKYTRERPDLRMQALVGVGRASVNGGETFSLRLDGVEILSAIAFNRETHEATPLQINTGQIEWKAPPGAAWDVVMVKHDFRTPQTRAVSDSSQSKTTDNSMGDLISPEATKLFIEWTHEEYKKHVGEFLGNTIIAFRGDEPEMTGVPWTPAIFDEFQKAKGYDVRPYLASFMLGGRGGRGGAAPAIQVTDEQRRAKADYFDVWSELFAKYFFDQQADWCQANGVWATTHLNNDHNMPALVPTTGDFYRAMRKYQAPGVDVIWSQIYPGKAYADFPKFASSAAHLFGHPRTLSESFAAFYDPVTVEVAQYDCNFQMVRGVNLFEFMSMGSSAPRGAARGPATAAAANPGGRNPIPSGRGYMIDPEFPPVLASINRTTYVLAQGKPMAQIAIYMPTMSMWMGDNSGNAVMMKIAQTLMENQRDFDFADEQCLSSQMKLADGQFINASGQSYRAVIVPTSTAISKATLDRLQTFAKSGGKVFFVGKEPSMVVEQTFLKAGGAPDLSWAVREPSGEITPAILAALQTPDVALAEANSNVKVMHRKWADAEVYFFFNESDQPQRIIATVNGSGRAQVWNTMSVRIDNLPGAAEQNGVTKFPLELEKYGAKLIVIGSPAVASAR